MRTRGAVITETPGKWQIVDIDFFLVRHFTDNTSWLSEQQQRPPFRHEASVSKCDAVAGRYRFANMHTRNGASGLRSVAEHPGRAVVDLATLGESLRSNDNRR